MKRFQGSWFQSSKVMAEPWNFANPWIYPWEATIKTQPMTSVVGFLPQPSGRGKKKEAALPQHYLSPNQIKPNYIFRKTSSNP